MEPELQNRVLATINGLKLNNLFLAQAKKADSFFKPRIIVAINDRSLVTFNIKGTKITNQFSWLSTKYIGRELNKLRFQFDRVKFAFDFTEEALFRAVSSALQNILTKSELKAIKFDQFRIPLVYSYPPSSALNRIKERSILLKEQVYENTLECIKTILIYSLPDVNTSDIPGIDKFLSIILDSLPFWSDIQTLSISEMGVIDPYKVTLQYATYFNSLKLLEMNCKKSPDFAQFMKELSVKDENQPKNLFGLSFTRSEFEREELNTLQKFIVDEKIQCLELHDAVNRNARLHFYTQFLSPTTMQSLTILNLDHTKNIANDISVIVPKCSNLLAISLADCDIEISEVLYYLSRLQKLRILNLSNNTCRKIINGLPPSITTLYLNSVNWCFQNLQLFLTNLPRHQMALFLNNINMQQVSDYDDLFVKLPTAKSTFLTGLSWDGNRIEESLFEFLGRNKNLRLLSLSNCFSKDDEKEVMMFQKYLTQFHTVKKLIIQGTKKKFLGNLVELVINGILKSPQIEFLDITQSRSGDFGLTHLRRLLSSRTLLQHVIFDQTKPTNFSTLSTLLRDSTQYRNIHVSFPLKDMKSMLKKEKITIDQFDQIQSLFINSSKPECVYINFYSTSFPRFFTPSEIEELKRPVVDYKESDNQQQQHERAETPKSEKNKNSNYNINYGTLNMKALKASNKNDLLNQPINRKEREQAISKNGVITSNQNDYLLRQNRKIAKMTPKDNDKNYTFDSASASYNDQDSSSNDFFIPNNINNDFEAQTVKNRPIRNNLKPQSANKKTTKTRKNNKAASLAPVKKRRQHRNTTNNINNNDDDYDNDVNKNMAASTTRKTRKSTRTSNSNQRPKTARKSSKSNRFIFDDNDENGGKPIEMEPTPKSTRSRRTTSSKKKQKRIVNDDDDYGFDNYMINSDDFNNHADVRPLLRSKKALLKKKTNRDFYDNENNDDYDNIEDDDDDDQRLVFTYQIPNWKFPVKMKFVYDTDTAKKIEDKYSDNSFVSTILNDINEQPKQKNSVAYRKK